MNVTIRLTEKESRQIEKHLAFRDMETNTHRQNQYMTASNRKYGSYLIAGYGTELFMLDLEKRLAQRRQA